MKAFNTGRPQVQRNERKQIPCGIYSISYEHPTCNVTSGSGVFWMLCGDILQIFEKCIQISIEEVAERKMYVFVPMKRAFLSALRNELTCSRCNP